MRYPSFLKNNGTLGFVAPSFGCSIEPYKSGFNNALRKWKGAGYNTILGPNCYAGEGIGISNTPKSCGEELTQMYLRDDVDCVISCGGGELMCEILDYVDFDRMATATPKWFMGYSDNTNFTFLSATLMDTAAIYGPCAASFGMEPEHQCILDARNLLSGKSLSFVGYDKWEQESLKSEENPLATINATRESIIHTYPGESVNMKGRLLGGCMDCLVTLLGTRFDKVADFNSRYKEDGIIWFLEACDLNVMGIRRAMWQMEHAGWFDNCSGFIIGRPMHFGEDMMGLDQYSAVLDVIGKLNVPVIMDADIGHIAPMMPIICGSKAEISANKEGYTVNMYLD